MPPAHLAGHVPCIQHLPAWETPQQAGAACQRIGHTSSPPLFADFGNNHKCLLAFLAENWGQAMQEGGGKYQEPASSLRSSPQQENAWKTVHCASPRRKPKKLAWGAVSAFMMGEVGGVAGCMLWMRPGTLFTFHVSMRQCRAFCECAFVWLDLLCPCFCVHSCTSNECAY